MMVNKFHDPEPAISRSRRIPPDSGFPQLLQKYAADVGLCLPIEALSVFDRYYRELLFWNATVNLTAITSPDDIAVKHFIDSLLPLKAFALQGTLVDIGSGAGFPGIPLKITTPELQVSLVESNRKKGNFLRYIIRTLNLDNTHVIENRAEDLRASPPFDNVIARAFSDTKKFLRIALPLLKQNGFIVLMKAKHEDSLSPIQSLKLLQKSCVKLPAKKGDRTILIYQKCFT